MKFIFKDSEIELEPKLLTGKLKEQITEFKKKHTSFSAFLDKITDLTIENNLTNMSDAEIKQWAVDNGKITIDEIKQFNKVGQYDAFLKIDVFNFEFCKLITNTKGLTTEQQKQFNEAIFSNGKFSEFWGEQSVIEVEKYLQDFRAANKV